MNVEEILKSDIAKIPKLTLLCEKNINKIICEEYFLGATLNIGNKNFKIDTLRFRDNISSYNVKNILSKILTDDYLCGLIPKSSYLRTDLFEYSSSISGNYIIVMRKKSPIQTLLQ